MHSGTSLRMVPSYEIPLDRLTCPGAAVSVTNKAAGDAIDISDLDWSGVKIRPDDIVALHTGWSRCRFYFGIP